MRHHPTTRDLTSILDRIRRTNPFALLAAATLAIVTACGNPLEVETTSRIPAVNEHNRTHLGELHRDRFAQAVSRAGDQCGFSVEEFRNGSTTATPVLRRITLRSDQQRVTWFGEEACYDRTAA